MNIASRNGFHCALVALCCSICAISMAYAPAVMAQDASGSSLKRSTIELRGNIGRIDAEDDDVFDDLDDIDTCLLYTSPSPRDQRGSRMPSSA